MSSIVKLNDGREVPVRYICDNPEEFGFRWSTESLEKPAGTVITKHAQIPVLTNLQKALATWLTEENILGMADSSSYRVKVQNPQRTWIYDERHMHNKVPELQEFAIETVLGIRSRKPRVTIVRETVFSAADGSQHKTQADADAATLAFTVMTLIDLGLSATEANDAARRKLSEMQASRTQA